MICILIETMNMYHALEITEIFEVIFAFFSRKNLYRSCTTVNRQWNSMSMCVIQKKRKSEFISISRIRDNIILHLYDDRNADFRSLDPLLPRLSRFLKCKCN